MKHRSRPFGDTFTMVSRSMKHTVRHLDILIMTAVLPLMQLLFLVYVFGGAMNTGTISYLDYVLPGILLMSIGSCASMAAISVKEDMCKGIMDRFRSMDISQSAVLNGHMAATLVRSVITTTVILGVSLLMGFRTAGMDALDYLTAFVILALFALAYTWISIVWGLLSKTVEAAGAFAYLGMFLPYLSSCFVPIETMPAALQAVGRYQPFTPLAESLRGLFLGSDTGHHVPIAIVWCVILFLAACLSAVRIYKSKNRG